MRLYPPAYGLGREAVADCEIGGYRVPAGTQVFVFQWVTQRDPRFFDDPLAFKPDAGPTSLKRNSEVRLLPFRRRTQGLRRRLIRDDGNDPGAGDDRTKIPARTRSDHPVETYPAMSLRPKNG
jgi:hypothetical protein